MNQRRTRGRHNKPPRTEPALGDLDEFSTVSDDARGPRQRNPPPRAVASGRRWPWIVLLLLVIVAAGAWTQRQTIRSWLPQTQLNQLLERADNALAAGKLDGHQGESARELYSAARALRADSARAEAGLNAVGQAELAQARTQLDAGHDDQAATSLQAARALLGGGDELDRLDKRLAQVHARSDKLEGLLQRAAQALADNHLDGKGGAAALYKQALVADPGNAIAMHGLDKVGVAMSAAARDAINQGQLDQAEQTVQKLGRLLPDFANLPELRAQLSQARKQAADAQQQLMAQADADLAAGRLRGSGSDNALARYRKVLESDPDNEHARQGIARVADGLLARAQQRMDDGRLEQASQLLDEVAVLAGRTPQLQAARKHLADLEQKPKAPPPLTAQQKARAQRLITRAQAAAEDGKLMLPPGNSAYDLYRSALAIDAGNSDAMAGLASLPGQARSLFDQALAAHDTGRAAKLLSAFSQLAPGSSALADMQARLDAARGAPGG
ncbi:MAG: hypothetical protein WCD66_09505 [Rhodanobacteraceae bacterium]